MTCPRPVLLACSTSLSVYVSTSRELRSLLCARQVMCLDQRLTHSPSEEMEFCMSKNLELFNQQTAEIFAVLWENFPVSQVITYEKFSAALPDDYFDQLNSPEMKSLRELRSVVEGTFTFLGENGYIQYETDHQTYFMNVRLTEKALTVLNKNLDALVSNETMGDKIISAVKDGTPGVIAGAVTNLLTLGVNLVTG